MSEISTLIKKLEHDKDIIYKCVRREDCSSCLCDDVRYSTCQFITPWSKFSEEYPSLAALLIEKLSEEKEDRYKTDWHPFPQEKPKRDGMYLVTIKGKRMNSTSAFYWDASWKTFGDCLDKVVLAWAETPEPYEDKNNG